MGNTNKFWKGMVAGAVAGAALSLLDRETRQAVGEKCSKASKSISYVLTHPKEIATNIKEKTNEWKSTVQQMNEDFTYIMDKIEEVRELTPEVTEMVKETKEAFYKGNKEEDSIE
ncbi:YtxH domain-containing protein [Neobacillus sp. D3-1R]|uniref:YtxH domain-containing protein n=1 Tax=Neobacillus sp. D3-1R TaxID=3445778 RepID=UPI003F9FBC77